MLEVLSVIALLCQINPGVQAVKPVEQTQLACQKYYVKCVSESPGMYDDRVKNCIIKREVR